MNKIAEIPAKPILARKHLIVIEMIHNLEFLQIIII